MTYDVRDYTKDDLPQILRLLGASLGGGPTGSRSAEFFAWKHLDNPFGQSPGLVAVDEDGTIVAVRLLLRWEFERGGETVRAVRAVDTATHPDAQGRGLFKKLTLQLIDTVDADFVFNTPNSNSRPGYLKMGWHEVGQVPVAFRVLRPVTFLRNVRTMDSPPPLEPIACRFPTARQFFAADREADGRGLEGLVAAQEFNPERLHTKLSPAYLNWRYGAAPGLDYRVVAAYEHGALAGVAFGRPRTRGPLKEFTLSQVLTRPGDIRTAKNLLKAVASKELSGCDHVATHPTCGSDLKKAALGVGYVTATGMGMGLVARTLRELPYKTGCLSEWQLSLGDLEVF